VGEGMNNLEKTIDEAIEHWKQNQYDKLENEDLADFITEKLLLQDTEFESALYQIVSQKLEEQ
jgi:hypothetical protein